MMRDNTVSNIAGYVTVAALLLWAVWPRQRRERMTYRRGAFPMSTNEPRNMIMSVFIAAWLVWLFARSSKDLRIVLGVWLGFGALSLIARLLLEPRRRPRKR